MKITNVALIGILLSASLFAQRDRRMEDHKGDDGRCLLYTSPSPRDRYGNVCHLETDRKS